MGLSDFHEEPRIILGFKLFSYWFNVFFFLWADEALELSQLISQCNAPTENIKITQYGDL